jgi:hypothetical protein
MPADATPLRQVPDRVDIGALAAAIQCDAADLLADTIAHTAANLDDEGEGLNGLSERQQAALVASALRHFDGFELEVAARLKRDLEQAGVATWGLPDRLERLLGGATS